MGQVPCCGYLPVQGGSFQPISVGNFTDRGGVGHLVRHRGRQGPVRERRQQGRHSLRQASETEWDQKNGVPAIESREELQAHSALLARQDPLEARRQGLSHFGASVVCEPPSHRHQLCLLATAARINMFSFCLVDILFNLIALDIRVHKA